MTLHSTCIGCGQIPPSHYDAHDSTCNSELYRRLSSTNCPLTALEHATFRQEVLLPALHRVSSAEEQLQRLRSATAALEAELETRRSVAVACRAVLSPLRGLPTELLGEIFQWYCSDDAAHSFDLSKGPWLISHVCGRWRNVALSTPSLWSHLIFDDVHRTLNHESTVLSEILQRGKNSPLSIFFDVGYTQASYASKLPEYRERLLEQLCSACDRWQHVSLILGFLTLSDMPFDLSKGKLGMLESLELSLSYSESIEENDWDIVGIAEGFRNIFLDSPRLERLKLDGFRKFPLGVPRHQLLSISESWPDIMDFRGVADVPVPCFRIHLENSPDLKELTMLHAFLDPQDYPWEYDQAWSFRHTSLRSLTISDGRLLDGLTLPCLEELHIRSIVDAGDVPCPSVFLSHIKALIDRSRSQLRALTIPDLTDSDGLVKIFQDTKELTSLTLCYNVWRRHSLYDEQLLDLLRTIDKLYDPSSFLLPHLKSLKVYIADFDTASPSSYVTQDPPPLPMFLNVIPSFANYRYPAFQKSAGRRRLRSIVPQELETIVIVFNFPVDLYSPYRGYRRIIDDLNRLKAEGRSIWVVTDGNTPAATSDNKRNVEYQRNFYV